METKLIELLLPVILSLAGVAFTAAQGSKWWQRVIAGREDRIMNYLEIGIRYAYQAFVKHRKAESGKLSLGEASSARDMALRAAGEEAIRNGDQRLLQRLSEPELNARLESILQEIKAMAAEGEPARVSLRANSMPKMPPPNFKGLIFLFALGPLLAGCVTVDRTGDHGVPDLINYEAAAREAWLVWTQEGSAGMLADYDASALSDQEAVETAFGYAAAVYTYAVVQLQIQEPRPDLEDSLLEAALVTQWYLSEAHPHVRFTWSQLQGKGFDAGRIAPLINQ